MEEIADITSYQISFNKKRSKKILRWYELKKSYSDCPELLSLEKSISQDAESFLHCLISKISDEEPSSQEEAVAEFRTLALLCTRPNFLFGTISKEEKHAPKKSFSAKRYKRICKELAKFDKKWKLLLHDRDLYFFYVERGSKNLNRDRSDIQDKLSDGEKKELINDLNKLYEEYYYSLLANHYSPVSKPKVDTRLVEYCYEKEWLLPISHIILIRYAQYQMMGINKYTQETLLQSGSQKFELKAKNKDDLVPVHSADKITYEICLKTREIMKRHIGKYFFVNPVLSALHGLVNIGDDDTFLKRDALGVYYSLAKVKRDVDLYQANGDQANLIFPVPDCNTYILSKQIGRALDLSVEQIDQLEKELPTLLWTRCNIENTLKRILADSLDTLAVHKSVISTISALRDFLNPYQYYSHKFLKAQETYIFSDQLVKSARFLHKKKFENCKSGSNTEIKNVIKVFSSFLTFRDLTDIGVVMSHTINPESGVVMPAILEHYLSKLKQVFKLYCKDTSVLRLICANAVQKEGTGYSTPIYDYEYDCCDLRYKRIKKDIAQRLTWDCAREFLLKCVCENTKPSPNSSREGGKNAQQLRQWKYIDEHFSEQLSYFDVKKLSNNTEKEFIYFKVFSYILKSSLQLLWLEMFKKMLSVFNKALGI